MTISIEAPRAEFTVRDGVAQLLDVYCRVGSRDRVVVCYTPDSRVYAAHVSVALKARGLPHELVPMKALIDPEIGVRIGRALPRPEDLEGNLVVLTLERDTMSHFEVFAQIYSLYGAARCRIVRIISATDEFFTKAVRLTPQQLSQRNATLLDWLAGATSIRVTTDGGTDLEIRLDQDRYDWISNRGTLRPGGFTILPAGEIATYPARVDGVLVADGALNCNVVTRLDMRLEHTPLTVEIEDSRAMRFATANAELHELVQACFDKRFGRLVGELGFGTNHGIGGFLAHNSHLNERQPGLHIGFGQHNQPLSVVPHEAEVHLDVITRDAVLHVPGRPPLEMSTFTPTKGIVHPTLLRDEDVTGDCCSTGCVKVVL